MFKDDDKQNEGENVDREGTAPPRQGLRRVMLFSFFVVPFCIAALGVALFTGVCMLTMDAPSISSLLDDVRHGYSNKRWQAAYQLVALLDTSPPVRLSEDDVARFKDTFAEADPNTDQEIRQYLALAMGCTRNSAFAPLLLNALATEPEVSKPFIVRSLGRLGDPAAAPMLATYLGDETPSVRLESVIALGALGVPESVGALQLALEDSEPNIQWDAAIALAKLGDGAGQPTLLALLDRAYLATFPEIDPSETNRILGVAIQAGALLNDPALERAIAQLASSDSNMTVRQIASETIKYRKVVANQNLPISLEGQGI